MAPLCIGAQEISPVVMPRIFSSSKRSSVQDLMPRLSKGSLDFPENVVVIMDGLKEPSIDLVEWVIQNFGLDSIDVSCSNITLLGTMPWLTIPSYCKTASDNWMSDIQDLLTKNKEWRRDVKYQKGQPLVEVYRKYGVTPNVESLMGYPTKLLVGERITSLHANLVVIDRHHDRKNFEYYGDKVPCNIIAMNDHGEFDIIKEQPGIDNHDYRELRATVAAPTPKTSINSDNWKNYLKMKISSGKLAKERKTFSGK